MSKKFISLIILFWYCDQCFSQNYLNKVDLFVCTEGDHGQLDPSATVPWGMIKVGPDTDPGNHSGYNFSAKRILGFSHNRIAGVGCNGSGGNLRVLPGIGSRIKGSLPFCKDSEDASPAYYTTSFKNNVKVELTATNNTAFHRYIYPKSDSAFINFNIESSFTKLYNITKNVINNQEFTISVSAMNVCDIGRYTTHFYVRCNKRPNQVTDSNGDITFWFKTEENDSIELSVTASTISPEDAIQEWIYTASNYTFDEVLKQGQKSWNDLLSKVEVSGNEEYVKLFYTHFYHMLLNPVKTENRFKEFRATNGQIYTSQDYTHYDSWSMWDNFRNKFSFYSLIVPEESKDMCNSLENLFRYGKPFWSGYSEPVPTVRTEHSIITLLDLYRRGITGFDIEHVYHSMCAEISNIPEDSPDKKLEKSYDYWALSEIAKILGKKEDISLFHNKAMEYKKIWKEHFSIMDETSDIVHAKGLYEGTVWQYRWHVQFDLPGALNLFDSKEHFTDQLEYFFENNLYNHGNQPDIHAPYLFNYGSRPWLTQKWVNKILTKDMIQYYGTHSKWNKPYTGRIYKLNPKGFIPEMDNDDGTMSSWYVLSSLGLYPLEVGKPIFQLSSPIFDKIVIHVSNEKTFEIITENLDEKNYFISKLTLNGEPIDRLFLKQEEITNGGKLIIKLSNKPNTKLGVNNQ